MKMLNKTEINNIKNDFLEVGRIDNPSGAEEKIGEWVSVFLNSFKIKPFIDSTKNLFFNVAGDGEPLLLNAHLDSVQICLNKEPQFDGKTFSSNGKTILGADDLAGIIAILHGFKYLKQHKIKHRALEILFSTMEEIGGGGIKQFDFSLLKSKEAVVVDSIASLGSVVIRSPSKYNFSIFVKGKASHGAHISKGISAIMIMADLIHSLPLGKINPHTFLNIGKIRGGRSINTVPGNAILDGSIKVYSEGEIRGGHADCQVIVDLILDEIKRIKKENPQAVIEFDYDMVRPGYSFNEHDDLVHEVKKVIKNSDVTPKIVESFGCSDANTLNAMGHKALLLGMGIKDAHTIKETIELNSIVKLTEFVIELCRTDKI